MVEPLARCTLHHENQSKSTRAPEETERSRRERRDTAVQREGAAATYPIGHNQRRTLGSLRISSLRISTRLCRTNDSNRSKWYSSSTFRNFRHFPTIHRGGTFVRDLSHVRTDIGNNSKLSSHRSKHLEATFNRRFTPTRKTPIRYR